MLPPLSALFATAFHLARARLGTLVSLALFPLIPLLLLGPFLAQVLVAVEDGMVGPVAIAARISPWAGVLAFLGLVGSFIVSVASVAGTFVALGKSADHGPRAAFRDGMKAWGAVVWTQLLASLAVLVAAVPSFLVLRWLQLMIGNALASDRLLQMLALLVLLLLMIPAFVVTAWYSFAVIPAARREAFGPAALAVSHRLVEGATGHVFGLLLAWWLAEMVLWVLLSLLFPGLALFQGFVYYLVTAILGSAYLVAVYQALRRS